MKGEGKLFFSLFKDMYVYIVIQCMPVKSQKKRVYLFSLYQINVSKISVGNTKIEKK